MDEEFTTYDKGFLASVELPTCNWAVAGKLVSIVTDMMEGLLDWIPIFLLPDFIFVAVPCQCEVTERIFLDNELLLGLR